MKTSESINIRSITLGLDHKLLGDPGLIEKLKYFNIVATQEFTAVTDYIRTKRICLTPINNQDGSLSQDRTASIISKMQDLIDNLDMRWGCVPVDLVDLIYTPDAKKTVIDILKKHDNIFINLLNTKDSKISIKGAKFAAEIIKQNSKLSKTGFDNFRLGVAASCGPNIPFFPFSYHKGGEPGFSIAIEILPFLLHKLKSCKESSIKEQTNYLINESIPFIKNLDDIAFKIEKLTGISYEGMDISLAPFPKQYAIGDILEKFGIDNIGSHGTTYVTSVLTDLLRDIIDRSGIKAIGFNGVMYSLLEDDQLASSNNKLNYSIDTLSLLSTVCGCGLDMIPIPGDTLSDEIASLILDISSLSINLKKPLGVRLLPIPEKTSGMMTEFNYDFLVNTRIMAVKNDCFESFKFTDDDQIYRKLRF
tara:strand:- start:4733 stop:5992 length:1260 start_codon:yes stop_codon:yes gene_type:complete